MRWQKNATDNSGATVRFTGYGVPLSECDDCNNYDGKRCKLTGFRPHGICEPVVVEMAEMLTATERRKPKFERTYCSSCGGEFGPRDSGFSHCSDHHGMVSK